MYHTIRTINTPISPAFAASFVGFLAFCFVLSAGVVQLDVEIQRDVDQSRHQLHRGQSARVTKSTHLKAIKDKVDVDNLGG